GLLLGGPPAGNEVVSGVAPFGGLDLPRALVRFIARQGRKRLLAVDWIASTGFLAVGDAHTIAWRPPERVLHHRQGGGSSPIASFELAESPLGDAEVVGPPLQREVSQVHTFVPDVVPKSLLVLAHTPSLAA